MSASAVDISVSPGFLRNHSASLTEIKERMGTDSGWQNFGPAQYTQTREVMAATGRMMMMGGQNFRRNMIEQQEQQQLRELRRALSGMELRQLPLEMILDLLPTVLAEIRTQHPTADIRILSGVVQRLDWEVAAIAFHHPDPQLGLVEFDVPRAELPDGAQEEDTVSLLMMRLSSDEEWELPDVVKTRVVEPRLVPNVAKAELNRWTDPARPVMCGSPHDDRQVEAYDRAMEDHHLRWDRREQAQETRQPEAAAAAL